MCANGDLVRGKWICRTERLRRSCETDKGELAHRPPPLLPRATVSRSADRFSPLELGHERASERCPDRFFQSLEVAEEHAQAFVAGVGPHDNLRKMSEA